MMAIGVAGKGVREIGCAGDEKRFYRLLAEMMHVMKRNENMKQSLQYVSTGKVRPLIEIGNYCAQVC